MFAPKKSQIIFVTSLILVFLLGCLNVSQDRSSLNSDSAISADSKQVELSQNDNKFSLDIPISCELGEDCFIMHYVDLDPSQSIVDFNCGRQTYDGHKGTDFGIANLQIMTEGIPVIAAASGTVLRIRDGIPDKLVSNSAEKQALANRECGNGVVLSHGNGWETQYCHLRQGSIAVKPNTKVERGTVLGMVGSSGLASFPHVHFSVRKNGVIIDPFVGTNTSEGCTQNLKPLWSKTLSYTPTGSIDAGFASKPPNQTELWSGLHQEKQLKSDIPALIFWVHAFGVLQGDVEKWQLIAPDGTIEIDESKTLATSFRSWFSYSGKRNIVPGVWRGEYQLWRDGSSIFKLNREVTVEK